MAPVRIYENLRTLSYAPFYLAALEGLFSKYGLDVQITLSPSPSETALGLLAGRVDIGWGGPMRVMKHHDADPDCPLVCFCKVVGAEPFSLIGREANRHFDFSDLVGLGVGVVTDVPTPWLLLQEDLRQRGINPDDINPAQSGSMTDNVSALQRGTLDVIQVMEPQTGLALAAGGHVWHRFAERGDVAFTSFYTTRVFASENADTCRALSSALDDALGQMNAAPPDHLATRLEPYFPDIPNDVLKGGIERYRDAGIWPSASTLGPTEFTRLKLALLSGRFITRDVPFERAVSPLES
ncbi:MAG: ABC transporter substrate-binding protein [Pseudomonadota bacterium]